MPFIHIRLAGLSLPPSRIEELNREVTDLVAAVLGKQHGLTAVLTEPAGSGALWTVGGQAPPVAAHLEIIITDGTNAEAEKAAFIDAAAALLRRVCGPELSIATYVATREIKGENWGYDGMTQAARRRAINDKQFVQATI